MYPVTTCLSVRPCREPLMALCTRFLTTAVLVAGLGIAPAAYAEHWHGGRDNYHQGGGNYHRGGGGNAAGAAIIGGIIGLGAGAAIAPPGYYGSWAPRPPSPAGPARAPTTSFQIGDNIRPRNDPMKTIRSSHLAS